MMKKNLNAKLDFNCFECEYTDLYISLVNNI